MKLGQSTVAGQASLRGADSTYVRVLILKSIVQFRTHRGLQAVILEVILSSSITAQKPSFRQVTIDHGIVASSIARYGG
jgi:hypothetical protein